jgi:hypothetical protein
MSCYDNNKSTCIFATPISQTVFVITENVDRKQEYCYLVSTKKKEKRNYYLILLEKDHFMKLSLTSGLVVDIWGRIPLAELCHWLA